MSLDNNKIILASSSPRRVQLLKQLGVEGFKTINHFYDEKMIDRNLSVPKMVVKLSELKAQSVLKKNKEFKGFIISGDTEVYRCGKIYSKTNNENQVKEYLKNLSGRKHFVYGGITVISPNGKISRKMVKTEVFFNRISEQDLNDKNLIKEGIGKAGGYAIQGICSKFVKKIKGSYTNVVGLSLSDLYLMLKGLGFKN